MGIPVKEQAPSRAGVRLRGHVRDSVPVVMFWGQEVFEEAEGEAE